MIWRASVTFIAVCQITVSISAATVNNSSNRSGTESVRSSLSDVIDSDGNTANGASGEASETEREGPSSVSFDQAAFDATNFLSDAPFEGDAVAPADHPVEQLQNDDVEAINSGKTTWTATSYTDFDGVDLRKSTGAIIDPESFKALPTIVHDDGAADAAGGDDLPASFDARIKWPQCHTIKNIRNQGQCGSCWAVSSASVMSDRLCIHKNKRNKSIASNDLINCCGEKCAPSGGDGCEGGWPIEAFSYWTKSGLPTETCQKYKPAFGDCGEKCDSDAPDWKSDLLFGSKAYRVKNDVREIQKEIMKFGSVVVCFKVYKDFANYKSGVYQHQTGEAVGGHAMRLIGWGEEGGSPYWLLANSWGSKWGEGGLVKFLRGSNHCGIEASIFTGVPK